MNFKMYYHVFIMFINNALLGWYLSTKGVHDKNCGRTIATPCRTLGQLLHRYYMYVVRKMDSEQLEYSTKCLRLITNMSLTFDETIQVCPFLLNAK